MKPRSCKSKGKLLQNLVREKLLENTTLHEDDLKSAQMGESREDLKLSTAALKIYSFGIECKNLAKIAVYKFYQQAQSHTEKIQAKHPTLKIMPLVIVKQNRSKPLVILDLDDFLALYHDRKD